MATHINTTNAIKGLTCAIEHFKGIEHILHISTQHPIQHLTNAATEIERLNSETIKLRGEIAKLKENTITAMQATTKSYREHWNTIIETIAATDVGRGLLYRGMDIDVVTDKAVAVINKTASDLKEALRTAEAFQKTQLEAEKKRDINLGWLNIESFDAINYALYGRLAGRSTRKNYEVLSHEVIDEVVRASEIHPKWPTDALHAVSILTEESGELMKAAIEYHYNNGDIEAVREEAVQTGAMALRVLLNIDKYKRPSDEK
ncbi:hypothetical protein [Yersinia enterocolitica]|uniref:hypothetical protein n=1 Tax=Yersinia enterocolitica TaxID=630 RepID=UPI003D7BD347